MEDQQAAFVTMVMDRLAAVELSKDALAAVELKNVKLEEDLCNLRSRVREQALILDLVGTYAVKRHACRYFVEPAVGFRVLPDFAGRMGWMFGSHPTLNVAAVKHGNNTQFPWITDPRWEPTLLEAVEVRKSV